MSQKLEQNYCPQLREVAERSLNEAFLRQFKQATMLGMGMTVITQEAYEAASLDLVPYRDSNELAAVASSLTWKFQAVNQDLAIIESMIKPQLHDARVAGTQALLTEVFLQIDNDQDLGQMPWDPNSRWRLYTESVNLATKLMKDPNSKKARRDLELETARSSVPDRRLKTWSHKLLRYASLPETLRKSAIESGKLGDHGDWLMIPGAVPLWQITAVKNKQFPDRLSASIQREAYIKKAHQDAGMAKQLDEHRKKGIALREQLNIDAKTWTEAKIRQVLGNPADLSLGVLTTLTGILTELSWVFDESAKSFTASRRSAAESRESLIDFLCQELAGQPNRAMLALTIMEQTNGLVNDPKPNIILHTREQFVTVLERWVVLSDETNPYAQKKQRKIIEDHHPDEVEIIKTWFGFFDYLKPRERQRITKDWITPYLYSNDPIPFDFMILGLANELRNAYPSLNDAEQEKCRQGVTQFIRGWYHDNFEALHQSFVTEVQTNDQEEVVAVQDRQNALRESFVQNNPLHYRFGLLQEGLNNLVGR